MRRPISLVVMTIVVPLAHGVQAPALRVPAIHGRDIVLDGRIDAAEWAGALTVTSPGGLTARLLHDGRHLYAAFAGDRFGFNSLCTAQDGQVRILHASAALGAVAYTRRQASWVSRDTAFTYGMRDTSVTDAARAQRDAYLATHGWVANTVQMGGGRAQEFRIALSTLGARPRIAVARFIPVDGGSPEIHRWPASVDSTDGCVAHRLVSGYVPSPLTFDPDRWAELTLAR